MLDSAGIAGKGLLKRGTVVELLKFEREKDNLFAEFPIGATIQDGGKRKRSDDAFVIFDQHSYIALENIIKA